MMDVARKKAYLYPLMIIGGLFFIFGFVTWAIAVLIPYLMRPFIWPLAIFDLGRFTKSGSSLLVML